jgi:proton-dependent oligopeptide transporter, POT family
VFIGVFHFSWGVAVRAAITAKLKGKEFFGHPVGLFALFLTEMWERFSYYGMRALLVMYMASYLLKDPERTKTILGYPGLESILTHFFGALSVQQMSSQIYGIYTSLVYLTPVFGGYLADRVMGQYRSVYLGGILMAIGHFLMASEQMFLLALLFLILGNGCFKPNISSQVGSLYAPGDHRRDGAFTIFYMGVNLGAFFSPLICGTLGQKVGWHWGFGAAGVGMMIGLVVYWLGSGLFPQGQNFMAEQKAEKPIREKMDGLAWRAVAILVLLAIFNTVFWAVYEEQGNVMQLWADERTNWNFLGWVVPSSWFQALNPMMIFAFAPLLTMFWARQNAKKKEPSSITKLGIGCVLLGLGYVFMIVAARVVPDGARGSVLWLFGATWLYTVGELYFSPIGLSLFTKVAPASIVSTMVGVFYLSSFVGNYGTGFIGMFYEKIPKDAFFAMLTLMGVGTGMIYLLLKRPIIRAIGREV